MSEIETTVDPTADTDPAPTPEKTPGSHAGLTDDEISAIKTILETIGETEVCKRCKISVVSVYKALAGYSAKMHYGSILSMRKFLTEYKVEHE